MRSSTVAEIKLNVGTVVVRVSTSFRKAEIAEARQQLVNVVTSAFDKYVGEAKAAWQRQKEARMPFKSKAQAKAAFSGALGPKMKARAETWAKETPNMKALPQHVKKTGKK